MPVKLIGDKGRLEQVLVILIRYALKFSSDKYIKIKPRFNETCEELTIELQAKRIDNQRESLYVFKEIEYFVPEIVEEGANVANLALIVAKKLLIQDNGSIDISANWSKEWSIIRFKMKMRLPKSDQNYKDNSNHKLNQLENSIQEIVANNPLLTGFSARSKIKSSLAYTNHRIQDYNIKLDQIKEDYGDQNSDSDLSVNFEPMTQNQQ